MDYKTIGYYDRQKSEMYDLSLATYVSIINKTNSSKEAERAVAFVNKKYISKVSKLELSLLDLEIRDGKLWF